MFNPSTYEERKGVRYLFQKTIHRASTRHANADGKLDTAQGLCRIDRDA